MRFALSGVIFCLDFGPFFFSPLVPLIGVFPLFIYLFGGYNLNDIPATYLGCCKVVREVPICVCSHDRGAPKGVSTRVFPNLMIID